MQVNFVKQADSCGCAVACIAMVLGKSYDEIRKDFHNNFENAGMTLEETMSYLSDFGMQIIRKEIIYYGLDVNFGRNEILKPFAPVHIVRVKPKFDSNTGHLVVMTDDGKLLCPDGSSEEEILSSYAITTILGIYRN